MPAPDAVDRILLREAATLLAAPCQVAVLDDENGGLVVGAADLAGSEGPPLSAYCDSAAAECRVLAELTRSGVNGTVVGDLAEAVAGVDVVLLRLPKSLAALEMIADTVARVAPPSVQLLGGARTKHLNRGMNEVLSRRFAEVRASLGQQKSRVLIASRPTPARASPPWRAQRHADLGITLCASGGVFADTSVDRGTRLLLDFSDQFLPAEHVLDLGCGNGILGVLAALHSPQTQVTAVDDSRAAVVSTSATAAANDVTERVHVRHAYRVGGSGSSIGAASVDLVLCNPPSIGAPPGTAPRRTPCSPTRPGFCARAANSGSCSTPTSPISRGCAAWSAEPP